ncbi:MAG TPA: hypothetical protein VFH54_15320 [Mycobacteriales bacterium]|nr:hypothetical protein [Mycobacteriales bacterium]
MAAVAVVVAVTGCGTTVSETQIRSANGQGGPGNGLTASSGPSAPGAVSGNVGQGTGAQGNGGANSLSGTGTSTGGGTAVGSGSQTPGGTALTATTITIGFGYVSDGNAANAAIGAAGISSGDPKGESQAVINYINKNGGIAGRKIVPVWQAYDATSTGSTASQDEAACANYTQDHHVLAVADSGLTDTLPACLLKAGVFMAQSGDIISHDNGFFHQYPNYVDVGTLSEDRFMAEEVQALQRQKWYSPWNTTTGQAAPAGTPKIGVLTINGPWWTRSVNKVLLPDLAKAGHAVAANDVFRVTEPQTTTEEAQTVSDIQGAVLRFRSDGVTHVIFTDPSGVLTLIFSRNAGSQHYYPRYGVSSGSGMQALVTAGDVDSTTLRGAIGVGWAPGLDLQPSAASHYATAATTKCLGIMKQAGYSFPDVNSQGIALSICDQLFFLADVLNRAAPNLTLNGELNAVAGIGSTFHAAADPLSFVSATRHDALQEGWDMEWNTSCNCARYVGNGYQIPDVND